MQSEKDTDSYLATISAYFIVSGAVTVTMKASAGFVTKRVLLGMALGIAVMIIGAILGKKTKDKMKPQAIKKAVYAVMAASGVINVISAII